MSQGRLICEYLHPDKVEVFEEVNSDKNKTLEKEVQTESEHQQYCLCQEEVGENLS